MPGGYRGRGLVLGGVPRCSSPPGAAAGSPVAVGRRWQRWVPRSSPLSPRDHLRGEWHQMGGVPWHRQGTLTTPLHALACHPSQPPKSPFSSSSRAHDLCHTVTAPCVVTLLWTVPAALPYAREAHTPTSCCCTPKTHPCAQPHPPSFPVLLGRPRAPHPNLVGAAWATVLTTHSSSVPAHSKHGRAWNPSPPPQDGSRDPQHGGHHWVASLPHGGHHCPPPHSSGWDRSVGLGSHLPSHPGHSRGLSVVGSEALALSSGCRAAHPPGKPLLGGSPPQALTAAEPPLPASAGAPPHRQEPEPTAGRASRRCLLYQPSRRRALYPEAPHYRTGSQLVPRRIWDWRYWLGRWLRAPFPTQPGRREGGLGTGRQPSAG